MSSILQHRIFDVSNGAEFEQLALEVFIYQYLNNKVYKEYVDKLSVDVRSVTSIDKIPFLPVDLFKKYKVVCENNKIEKIFESSGTTGADTSSHFIASLKIYIGSFFKTFEMFYGDIEEYCIIGLLPSYLERNNSSLVFMIDYLIKASKNSDSGFYLDDYDGLVGKLSRLESVKQKTIIFGVSYALMDLADKISFNLKNTIIIETGGMKGRREELPKAELHRFLKRGFGVEDIHSEYGMTELLSQAYSKHDGLFVCPPWMRVLVRDIYDPFEYKPEGVSGGLNIIDFANINSCSFIETKDLGKSYKDNTFEILGRYDNSDIRGCNLMVV